MSKCDFNKVALQSHFSMGVLLQICCIFSEHLFVGTPLGACFWISMEEIGIGESFWSSCILIKCKMKGKAKNVKFDVIVASTLSVSKMFTRLKRTHFQKQASLVFYKDSVLQIWASFTRKHLRRSLFLIKLQALDLQLY